MRMQSKVLVVAIVLAIGLLVPAIPDPTSGEPVSGAIFTTDKDGLLVNGNLYESMDDVYLSGGPGPNAPAGAAGLPDGDYYFQVTDPSGTMLLSKDAVSERIFRVHGGIIVEYLGPLDYKKNGELAKNQRFEVVEEITNEYGENAVVIQLAPYMKTPNKGGIYKAWATPTAQYDPENPLSFHGFISQYSKTDNYKIQVKGKPQTPPPTTYLQINKFYDANRNGVQDVGESTVTGWAFGVTDPLGVTNYFYSPCMVDVTDCEGTYTVEEIIPQGTWIQTAVAIDGIYQETITASVDVVVDPGVTSNVLFGNIALGWNGGGFTPGYWHNKNGQAEIGADDLTFVNALNPFKQKAAFYPSGSTVPFTANSDISVFLVGEIASEQASDMRYKLAKFFLAMSLNIYNDHMDTDSIIYLGPGDFRPVGEVMSTVYAAYPWNGMGWDLATQTYYQSALDGACNNQNFIYTTMPAIVY